MLPVDGKKYFVLLWEEEAPAHLDEHLHKIFLQKGDGGRKEKNKRKEGWERVGSRRAGKTGWA